MRSGIEGNPSAQRIWLSYEWQSWMTDGSSSIETDGNTAARPYSHWAHAERTVGGADAGDEMARGVVMHKLWNAIDARTRFLFSTYDLRTLARRTGWDRPRRLGALDVLERLGLVRGTVLRELKSIRDRVEHQDEVPPSLTDCQRFVDTVWYFLRSTDGLAARVWTEVGWTSTILPGENGFSVNVTYDGTSWEPVISAHVEASWITQEWCDGALEVSLHEPIRIRPNRAGVWLDGDVVPRGPVFEKLARDYFWVDTVEANSL